MYEPYWQLETKPFENSSDARFYFPSETHQAVLLKLRYAIENRRGAALLTGDSGLGKTLLVRALISQLPESFDPVAHLVFPQMPSDQLLSYLADELTGQRSSELATIDQSIHRIESALVENAKAGRHAFITVDEAHLLWDEHTLETLRLLLNFEYEAQPLLTILFSGQVSLLSMLERMPELDERMGVKCLLRRFTLEETSDYILHRLSAAGAQQQIFEQDALQAVYQRTQGRPRRINRLCDLALLVGFAEERASLSAKDIEAVDEELATAVLD